MSNARLLFVDDEPSIRVTLPKILEMHNFDVTVAASVAEALSKINSQKFDVLLSDLNIGEPGDGFTVVSAMRRTQPQAITIIITGYPAFETALQAIRNQVDDYVVKPAQTEDLIRIINERVRRHDPHVPPQLKKLSFIVEENLTDIIERYVSQIIASGNFPIAGLTRDEIINSSPQFLAEVCSILRDSSSIPQQTLQKAARNHSEIRCRQKFTVPMLIEEMRMLRNTIYLEIEEHLLTVDLSTLVPDMICIAETLDRRLQESVESYLSHCGLGKSA